MDNEKEFDEIPMFGDMEEDPELKEAAENFFKALQHKTDREAQRLIEKWPTDVLRNKIIKIVVERMQSAAPNIVTALAILKLLGKLDDDGVDVLVREHCELQVKILKRFEIDMPDTVEAVQTLIEVETTGVTDFIKDHTGAHSGCVIDEYKKRMENEWPEVVGGVS
jgi:hypothetical protein